MGTSEQEIPILFVQIQPTAFRTFLKALWLKYRIANFITTQLKLTNNGDWAASDLGQAGINILFEVRNTKEALPIIISALKRKNLADKAVIGERIYTALDDWTYQVVYPENYKGLFNAI